MQHVHMLSVYYVRITEIVHNIDGYFVTILVVVVVADIIVYLRILQNKSDYSTLANKGRADNSKIMFWAFRLSYKNHIKTVC